MQIPAFFSGQQLPLLEEILLNTRVCSLPMNVTFRGVQKRETALIRGPYGWGEFAPFLEYGTVEASSWLASALEAAWLGFPDPVRTEIPLNSTVPAVSAAKVPEVLSRYRGEIREVKIKVAEKGQSLDDDVARVRVVSISAPHARLKIDANGGWSEGEAVEALSRLEEFNLLYAEQPVATVEGLARVREKLRSKNISTPIAADESVRKAEDPLEVARLGAADVLVVKAAPLGGVHRALALVEMAGLPAVVSSALESSVGIRTGAALAAALPQLPFGCGLGTVSLMKEDVVADSLVAENGALYLRSIAPSEARLGELAVSAERKEWWHRRITDCYHYLLAYEK
ncbi:o-succinylbenzoate synthase [uncultured Rothia sp.]|uniref:o-succinylbenzoate synthase n=1 Tax=uncultured Rothia sp. TaxID=316088 RepID=UPI003216F3F1